MAASARTSSSVPTPPLAITGTSRRGDRGGEAVDVRPAEQAVAVDVGDHERRRRREAGQGVGELHAARLGPPVHGDVPAAVVEPDRHRQHPGDVVDERRLGGRRPTPSRRGSRRRRRAPWRRRPSAPRRRSARRRARRPPRRWRRRAARLVALAGAGGVEVDDVDPRRALLGERRSPRRPRRRRRRSRRRSRPGAAARRGRRAGRSRGTGASCAAIGARRRGTKLPSRPSPADADFSGWNWAANTLPARNAAFSVAPYSHVATTVAGSSGTPWRECTK